MRASALLLCVVVVVLLSLFVGQAMVRAAVASGSGACA